jgi:hypothetical protein
MAPLRGWCARGQRLKDHVPHGHWKTLTFIAALRHDRVTAPCLLDAPINGNSFRVYVEQFLLPTLSPGDIVVMDNLGSHKGMAVRNAIRSVKAHCLFLPAYSPDPRLRGDKPQSDRADVRQAQNASPQSPCPNLHSRQ